MRKNTIVAMCLLVSAGTLAFAQSEKVSVSPKPQTEAKVQTEPRALIETETARAEENYCYVTIYKSNGDLAKYTTVSTSVSGGLFCSDGRDFTTDDKGTARLLWGQDCKLEKVYIKGKAYSVNYRNGGSYSITLE